MCSVAAVGVVSIGMQIAGNIMKSGAQAEGARANADYYNSLANTTDEQAQKILDEARIQQKYVVASAAKESRKSRDNFKRTIGLQKVAFASNGIGSGSVTSMDVALDSLDRSAEDEDLIRYNADVTANEIFRGSTFQADQLRGQAEHYRTAARNEISAINDNFLANMLSTGATAASGITQLNRVQ